MRIYHGWIALLFICLSGSVGSQELLTQEQARNIAQQEIQKDANGIKIIVQDDKTRTYPFGWVFFPVTEKYAQTKQIKDAIPGLGPFVVDRVMGEIAYLSSLPIEKIDVKIQRYAQQWMRQHQGSIHAIPLIEHKKSASYGIPIDSVKGTQWTYPDFIWSYVGRLEKKSNGLPTIMFDVYQFSTKEKPNDVFEVRWTSGLGDISPVKFFIGQNTFILEKGRSKKLKKPLIQDQIVIWNVTE